MTTVTVPSTAGLQTGNIVTIVGSGIASGVAANLINITAMITVASATTFTYTATGANGSGVAGGGANAGYYFPALPISTAIAAGLTGASTSQFTALTTPASALQCVVTASTGGSLNLTLLQQGID